MRRPHLTGAATVALLLLVGIVAFGAVTPAAASHVEDGANYTVILPEKSDHLPGDQNQGNASIIHSAAGGDAFSDTAPNGFETFDRLEIRSEAVDFSGCDSPNTAVFGIDRGNNNSGTQTDTDLLNHMKQSNFRENSLEVVFYSESDFGGNPTYLNPEDAILAVQGAGSSGGPCYTMPSDPGWYQITGTLEGTTEDGESVTINAVSHYFAICEGCHDEATAREKLGPRPSSESSADPATATPTPTPTATATATPTPDGNEATETEAATATATAAPTATAEPTEDNSDTNDGGGPTDGGTNGGADTQDDNDDGIQRTPTPGEGPGFGAVVGLLALLASGLLARHR
ncbi:PGF-CTERM sorting domain-containing protein [Natronomonas halophila]|uniref:PGF-CTERM sorting domain-containing protein n=1 Tax=Natronomonas halophila TaxID=2747817 RepID=UPI0015B6D019|nr:PGF-CTERM sorting domain-containing protein [Natronomonas halophila]QLD85730.1 PGF-CTERM sorting domain-containing protein [Natronomonas halophila]